MGGPDGVCVHTAWLALPGHVRDLLTGATVDERTFLARFAAWEEARYARASLAKGGTESDDDGR